MGIQFFKKTCLVIGFLFFSLNTQAQDQRLSDSLVNIYHTQNYSVDTVTFYLLHEIAFNQTNADSALKYAELLISLAATDSSYLWLHRGYFQKGNAYKQKGTPEEALYWYIKSGEMAGKAQYARGLAGTYITIGDVYTLSENYETAAEYYEKALPVFQNLKDSINLATTYFNLGNSLLLEGKLEEALFYTRQSEPIFKSKNHEIGIGYSLGNIGLIYANQGDYAKAEANMTSAIEILDKSGNLYPIAVYYNELAKVYVKKGETERAIHYAQKSLLIAEKEGLKAQIRDASLELSELFSQTKEYEKAYHHHSQYVAYRDSINNEETIRKMADLRTRFEVAQKQAEIDLLYQKREKNYIIGLALLVFIIFLSVLTFLLYRNNRIKRTANKLLHAQHNKLEVQHNKLEALNNTKDRFFSIISHDLRGPINAFNGISELIKYYISRNEMGQLREVSEHIDKSARQLSTLLDNLLDWSLRQQGTFPYRPEMLSLTPLLKEIMDMFRISAYAKNITLNLDVQENLSVWADRNSLTTIIRNLLNNALKFTQHNGLVTLSAYNEPGFIYINVIDTGVGIAEEKLENLFLLQDKVIGLGTSGEKGLGIGLSLAQEFTHMNKGSLIVNSEEGVGTIFTVKIPSAANPEMEMFQHPAMEEETGKK